MVGVLIKAEPVEGFEIAEYGAKIKSVERKQKGEEKEKEREGERHNVVRICLSVFSDNSYPFYMIFFSAALVVKRTTLS